MGQNHTLQAQQGCIRCPHDAPHIDQAVVRVVPITTARGRDAGTEISSKDFPKQCFRGFSFFNFFFLPFLPKEIFLSCFAFPFYSFIYFIIF